jgi:hypothetical protein
MTTSLRTIGWLYFAADQSLLPHLLAWIGRFHILVVHFPIALMIAGALAEMWNAWGRNHSLRTVVRFCTLLGAAGAAAAAALGWLHADFGGFGGDLPEVLNMHRWLGTAAALSAVASAALCERCIRLGRGNLQFRFLLLATAALISAAAHFGGTLVHGDGFFEW